MRLAYGYDALTFIEGMMMGGHMLVYGTTTIIFVVNWKRLYFGILKLLFV